MEAHICCADEHIHRKRLISVAERKHPVGKVIIQQHIFYGKLAASLSDIRFHLKIAVNRFKSNPKVFQTIISLHVFLAVS